LAISAAISGVGPTASIQASWPSVSRVTVTLLIKSGGTSISFRFPKTSATFSRTRWLEMMEIQVFGSIWLTEIHWVPWLAVRRIGGVLMRMRARARYMGRSVTAETAM
jgi:hypothetical protein